MDTGPRRPDGIIEAVLADQHLGESTAGRLHPSSDVQTELHTVTHQPEFEIMSLSAGLIFG